jgi:NADPH:quinone reductase-like Zn-dependent oxidoreductase
MRAAIVEALNTVPIVTKVPRHVDVEGTHRITVIYAGLQPTDVLRVRGIYKNPPFPHIIGGEGVGRLADGTRVYFAHSIPTSGAFCEETIVLKEEVWPIPDTADAAQVIALGLAGIGALIPLEEAQIKPGDRTLILGATGPVGQIGCLVARRLGAGVIVGAARDVTRLEAMRSKGLIDEFVQLGAGDDDAALMAQAGDAGYNVILDPLFGPPAEAAFRASAEGCRFMSIGTRAARTMSLTLTELRRRSHIGVDTGIRSPAERQAAFDRLLAYAAEGDWKIDILQFDLEDTQAAWEAQCGSPGAKIVIKVADA